jgi:hypothetical protein
MKALSDSVQFACSLLAAEIEVFLQASSNLRCPQQRQSKEDTPYANFQLEKAWQFSQQATHLHCPVTKERCGVVQEAEKRLRDIVTGKKPSSALAVNGTAARKMGGKQRQQLFYFTVSHPLC